MSFRGLRVNVFMFCNLLALFPPCFPGKGEKWVLDTQPMSLSC